MKSKTLVMMGLAEKGKTPGAQALARLAISEYWILVDSMAWDVMHSFRLGSSLDQLRGESGRRHVPDILDDPDTRHKRGSHAHAQGLSRCFVGGVLHC